MSGSSAGCSQRGHPFPSGTSLTADGLFSSGPEMVVPLPKIPPDTDYEIDIFTAASLNSENFNTYLRRGKSVVNEKNAEGWTPLMYAVKLVSERQQTPTNEPVTELSQRSDLSHLEVSQLLLASGADPSIATREGQTPLMLAASCGSVDVVRNLSLLLRTWLTLTMDFRLRLLSKRISDAYGRSSLHYAIKYNQAKITEMLLQGGGDPNLADLEGNTPTLLAIKVGNEATVAMLLAKYGGDVERQNKKDESGMRLAEEHPKILALLKEKANSRRVEEKPIVELFTTLGLEKYAPLFIEKGVFTLSALSKLSEKDIEATGVTLFGPKKKIMNLIREHRGKHASVGVISGKESPHTCTGGSPIRRLQSSNGEAVKTGHSLAEICSSQAVSPPSFRYWVPTLTRDIFQRQLLLKVLDFNVRLRNTLETSRRLIAAGGGAVTHGELQAVAKSLETLAIEVGQMNSRIDEVLLEGPS